MYFRRLDENKNGGNFDSQSQRPSLSQYQGSQFGSNNTPYGGRNGSNNQHGGQNGGVLSANYPTQMDASQPNTNNISGCDSNHYVGVKQEIDLLDLCNNINEEVFSRETNNEQVNNNNTIKTMKKQVNANNNNNMSNIQENKKKLAGTGQFKMNIKADSKSIANNASKTYKQSSQVIQETVTQAQQMGLDVLQPKVNRKYQISPVKTSINISSFMGVKQEHKSDNSNNSLGNQAQKHSNGGIGSSNFVKSEFNGLIKAEERSSTQSNDSFDSNNDNVNNAQRVGLMSQSVQEISATQANNVPVKGKAAINNKNKQMISVAEFASNVGATDFFNSIQPQPQQDSEMSSNNQEDNSRRLQVPKTGNKKVAGQQLNKNEGGKKKRKLVDISKTMQLNDEVDEEDIAQSNIKKRKLNTSTQANHQFDQPLPRMGGLGKTSGFVVGKKNNQLSTSFSTNTNRNNMQNAQNLQNKLKSEFASDQFNQESSNFLTSSIFGNNNSSSQMFSGDGSSNLISRKVRCQKHGINWAVGDLADFRLKNPDIAEKMQKLTKKIRVMLPLNEFNVHNNSNMRGRQNLISDRGSGSSTASNVNQQFIIDGLIVIENPIIISEAFNDKINDCSVNDTCYTTVMGSKVQKYDVSKLSTSQIPQQIMSDINSRATFQSQLSNITV
eukprot:403331174